MGPTIGIRCAAKPGRVILRAVTVTRDALRPGDVASPRHCSVARLSFRFASIRVTIEQIIYSSEMLARYKQRNKLNRAQTKMVVQ